MMKTSMLLICLLSIVYGYTIEDMTPEQKQWKAEHDPMELLNITEQYIVNAKRIQNFRASVQGVLFSGVFSDNAVLQREPYHAALYGIADTPNTPITLNMIDQSTNKITKYNTNSMKNGDWKITLPLTYKNGGNFTFVASCAGCNGNFSDRIVNVTFGDVFYCAGQVKLIFISIVTHFCIDQLLERVYKLYINAFVTE